MTTPFRTRPPSLRQIESLRETATRLIDRGYHREAGIVLRGFNVQPNTRLWRAIEAMEDAAAALEQQGRILTSEHPAVKELSSAFRGHLLSTRRLFDEGARKVVDQAAVAGGQLARRLTLGSTDASVMPDWNVPDIRSLRRLIGYTDSPAWRAFLADYPDDLTNQVVSTIARDFVMGKGPIASARHVRELVQDLPRHVANNKLRTLQMTALRDAQAVEYNLNGHLLQRVIRIATFDARACAACLALHGSNLRPGQRVDGHNQCRCTSVGELKGSPRSIASGEDWLRRQPDDVQARIVGRANLKAFKAGDLTLADFVGERTDPVFGRQVIPVNPRRRGAPVTIRRPKPAAPTGTVPPDQWKTVKDASAYIKGRWPHLEEVDFAGIDLANVKEIHRAAEDMAARHPEAWSQLRRLITDDYQGRGARPLAWYEWKLGVRTPGIVFEKRAYAKDRTGTDLLTPVVGGRRWAVGSTHPYSVFVHEFGHHHDYELRERYLHIAALRHVSVGGVGRISSLIEQWQRVNKPDYTLSEYALYNKFEAWAEAFSQRELMPRSEWHPYTVAMDELLAYVNSLPHLDKSQWKVVADRDLTDAERAEREAMLNRWQDFGFTKISLPW